MPGDVPCSELREDVAAAKQDMLEALADYEPVADDWQDALEELEEIGAEWDEANAAVTQLLKEKEQKDQRKQELEGELSSRDELEQKVADKQLECTQAEQAFDTARQAWEDKVEELQSIQDEIDHILGNIEIYEDKVEWLTEEIAHSEELIDILSGKGEDTSDAEAEKADWEQQLADAEVALAALEEEESSLNDRFWQVTDEIPPLEKALSEAEEKFEQCRQELSELEAELDAMDQLQEELDEVEEWLEEFSDELDSKIKEVQALRDPVKEANKAEMTAKDKETAAWKDYMEALEAYHQLLRSQDTHCPEMPDEVYEDTGVIS